LALRLRLVPSWLDEISQLGLQSESSSGEPEDSGGRREHLHAAGRVVRSHAHGRDWRRWRRLRAFCDRARY
jgi:hypothetical protein